MGIRAGAAGALMAGAGALPFGTGNTAAANTGRFLQGAGGVFALVGAVYIASQHFPASRAATLIGGILHILLPGQVEGKKQADWLRSAARAFAIVFRNPQSILRGLIAGLLFIPTTIFDMIWGVRFLQEAPPPQFSGTATGVINFLNFTFSALLGPVFGWILQKTSGGTAQARLQHYQTTFEPLLFGVALAIILTLVLRETGPAARALSPTATQEEP
jgi:hypothetical protein